MKITQFRWFSQFDLSRCHIHRLKRIIFILFYTFIFYVSVFTVHKLSEYGCWIWWSRKVESHLKLFYRCKTECVFSEEVVEKHRLKSFVNIYCIDSHLPSIFLLLNLLVIGECRVVVLTTEWYSIYDCDYSSVSWVTISLCLW